MLVPPTPAVLVPLVDAPAAAAADGSPAADLSSTGAVVGVVWQPARNAAAMAARTILFMGPPARDDAQAPNDAGAMDESTDEPLRSGSRYGRA
jgi:hypothetical protein